MSRSDAPKVSIVMRSFNEVRYIEETVTALGRIERPSFEIIHVDSGSTDGTLEFIRSTGNRLITLRPEEYTHSHSLNEGARAATGEIIVSLNADATPQTTDFLERLVAPFERPEVAGTFARQVPRDDATPFSRRDLELGFGPTAEPYWGLQPFSMSCAAVRRNLWQEHPFWSRWGAGDDSAWSLWATQKGLSIEYVPEAVVMHSHNYGFRQYYRKIYRENKVLAYLCGWSGWKISFPRAALSVAKTLLADVRDLARKGHWSSLPECVGFRTVELVGRYRGFRAGRRSHLEEKDKSVKIEETVKLS